MLPVLVSINSFSISSLGLFLCMAFLLGTFLIWRLARAWEVNNEVLLDAVFFTSGFAFVGARLFFVLANFEFFSKDLTSILNFIRYPGFYFWGAFGFGLLALYICTNFPQIARSLSLGVLFSSLSESKKLSFYQIADIGAVGFLGGLILGNLGCLLGGCDIGMSFDGFFGVDIIGVVGRRFPVPLLEAFLFTLVLARVWKQAIKFHFHGKIISIILIYIGLVKIVTQFFRDPATQVMGNSMLGFVFAILTLVLGIIFYYVSSKGSLVKDIKKFTSNILGLFSDKKVRKGVVEGVRRSWYNKKVSLDWKFRKLKKFLRRARVKPTPENFQKD